MLGSLVYRSLMSLVWQAMKVDSTRILINEGGINNIASCGKLCANKPNISYEKDTTDACTKSSNHCNSDREKLQSIQDSKKKLSHTAISSLIRKRTRLVKLFALLFSF
jgi:hypothetical protein